MLKIEKYAAINLLVLKGGDYGKFNGLSVDVQVELPENKAGVDSLNLHAVVRKDKQGKTEVRAGLETHFENGVTVGAEASNKGGFSVHGGMSYRF